MVPVLVALGSFLTTLTAMAIPVPAPLTPEVVGWAVPRGAQEAQGRVRLHLSDELTRRIDTGNPVAVPTHIAQLFNFLHPGKSTPDAEPSAAD